MSLDKFFGGKAPEKKSLPIKKVSTKKTTKKSIIEEPISDAEKGVFHLKCTKKGCKYQRTLKKKTLEEKDLVCKACGSEMKQFTPRKEKSESDNEESEDNE